MNKPLASTLRLLNVTQDEARVVGILLALSVCVGVSRLLNSTTSNTLFLVTFNASLLPYIYALMAVVVPLIGLINTRLERRVPFARLLFYNLFGYWLILGALRAAMALTNAHWPVFVYSLWSEVGWIVMNLMLWGLAGRLLTVRQGKRFFGVIGAAGGLAAIGIGFVVQPIIRWVGAPNLLLVVMVALAVAIGLLIYVARAFSDSLEAGTSEDEQDSHVSWRIPARYIYLIVIMAMLAESAFYFVDIIFYKQVQFHFSGQSNFSNMPRAEAAMEERVVTVQFSSEAALAGFMGKYLSVMNLLALLSNLFLVTPLIRRLGMRGGLLMLPLATGVVSLVFALGAAWVAPSSFLFGVATVNSVVDWVIRDTLFRSAVLILYQPLPPMQRSRTQTQVESIAMPIAQGVTGIILVGLAALNLTTLHLDLILLVLVVACLVLALLLARAYSPVLMEALSRRVLNWDQQSLVLDDPSSRAILLRELQSPYPDAVVYSLDALEATGYPLDKEYLDLLNHPAPRVRSEVLVRLGRKRLVSSSDFIKNLLDREQDLGVRAVGFRALADLAGINLPEEMEANLDSNDQTLFVIAMVSLLEQNPDRVDRQKRLDSLLDSSQPAERKLGLQIVAELTRGDRYIPFVAKAFQDVDLEVRYAAIRTAVEMDQPALWQIVFSSMNDAPMRSEVVAALVSKREKILPLIRKYMAEGSLSRQARIACVRVLGKLHFRESIPDLLPYLGSTDIEIRQQTLQALFRCGFRFDTGNSALFLAAVKTEILDAFQTASLRTELVGLGDPIMLYDGLEASWNRHRERVFMLLRMRYDSTLVLRVMDNLSLGLQEKRAYALEVLDEIVGEEYRPLLVPLFDDGNLVQCLASWKRVPALQGDLQVVGFETLLDLPADYSSESRTPWIKSCIIQAYSRESRLKPKIASMNDAESLVQNTLAWARNSESRKEKRMLSIIERVFILKTVSIFGDTPDYLLAEVADLLEEEHLPAEQTFITKGDPATCMYIIVKGEVRIHDADKTFNTLGARDIVGEMAVLDPAPRSAFVTTLEPTHLLKLDRALLFELIADRPEVAQGIIKVLAGRLREVLASAGR